MKKNEPFITFFKSFTAAVFIFSTVFLLSCVNNGTYVVNSQIEEYTGDYSATYSDLNLPKDNAVYDENQFGNKTAFEITEDMGWGWCLGNTLEATGDGDWAEGLKSETCWGQPRTTKEMIDFLSNAGVKTIRLPITWHNHLIDKNYTLDPQWLSRIKEIADWALEDGMYVIINTHHDEAGYSKNSIAYGTGFYPQSKDKAESTRFLFNVWSQIAETFNNSYDQHLIFEAMNEPHMPDYPDGYSFGYNGDYDFCVDQAECVNLYNQVILEAIRKTGGNNSKRFVMISGICADFDYTLYSGFKFPVQLNDTAIENPEDHQLLSIHIYEPSELIGNTDAERTEFTDAHKATIQNYFRRVYEEYIAKGVAVVDGEFGSIDKKNIEARTEWIKFYIETARKFHIACCYWDNNGYKKDEIAANTYGLFNRKNLSWYFPEIAEAAINAAKTPFEENPLENFEPVQLDNYLEKPISLDPAWKKVISLPSSLFYYFEPGAKLEITISPLKEAASYRLFALFHGDWNGHFMFAEEELENAAMDEDNVAPKIEEGTMTITLNKENLGRMQKEGFNIMGYGFTIEKIQIVNQ